MNSAFSFGYMFYLNIGSFDGGGQIVRRTSFYRRGRGKWQLFLCFSKGNDKSQLRWYRLWLEVLELVSGSEEICSCVYDRALCHTWPCSTRKSISRYDLVYLVRNLSRISGHLLTLSRLLGGFLIYSILLIDASRHIWSLWLLLMRTVEFNLQIEDQ